jgi:acyl-CoA thioester hydrolase
MSKIFTRSFRVRWSETDAEGQVGITSYLRYLMETAWDWGAAGGLSLEATNALGHAWIVRETQFRFFRPLRTNDRFDFTIWLLEWRRVRGTRAFEIRLQDSGEVVAHGAQQVAVLDMETMRPTSPPAHLLDYYLLDDPRPVPVERFPRVPPVPEAAFRMERRVEARDLDQLEIIDNSVFGAFSEEASARALAAVGWSPAELSARGLAVSPRRFHILHQTPAVWGDRLDVSTYLLGLEKTGGEWAIVTQRPADGASISQCILRWALVDRAGGEPQRLPESLSAALRGQVAVVN